VALYEHPEPLHLIPAHYTMEQVGDRIASLYEGVERKYRGTLPVGDPRLSSPPIHRGDPLIPDSLAGFGAEAERTFYTLNPQGGASVTTGPGYDPAYVASPWSGTDVGGSPSSRRAGGAGGLEGGNFCDEGVLIGRCVIQQPVRFEGDYTISGVGTVPVTRVQECNCNTAACTCKISFGDFLPDHADLTWARLTLEVERPGVTISAQEQVVTSALVDGRTFGGQCDPPRTCGVSKDAMVCPEECGSYHTCVGNAEVTAQALDGYVEVSVTSGRTLFLGGSCGGHVLNVRATLQAEYVTMGVLDIKPGGGLHCTTPGCNLTITGFRHVNIAAGSGVSSHTLSLAVPRISISGNVYAISLKVFPLPSSRYCIPSRSG